MTDRHSNRPVFRLAHSRRALRAFSLVELMVVIGIIALLISLLMPAIGMVRERGNQTRCLATLRSIGQAAQYHVNDHQQYLPCAGWQWDPPGGTANPKGLGDEQARRYDYYHEDDEQRPLPITAALARYMGVNVNTSSRDALERDLQDDAIQRLFRCPSQEATLSGWTQRDSTGWQSPDETSSYIFNEALLGRRDRDPRQNPFPLGHITDVARTSDVFFAADGRTRDPQTDRCFLVFDYGSDDTLQTFQAKVQSSGTVGKELVDYWRHRHRINVLFVDWHAQTFSTDAGGLEQVGVTRGMRP